jgi:hypothetical protein
MAGQGKPPQQMRLMRSFQRKRVRAAKCSRLTEALYRGEQQVEAESRRLLAMYLHLEAVLYHQL